LEPKIIRSVSIDYLNYPPSRIMMSKIYESKRGVSLKIIDTKIKAYINLRVAIRRRNKTKEIS